MTLATLFTALPISQVQASTNNSVVRLEKHPQYGYQFDSSYPAPFSISTAYKDWWTFHMNVNSSGYEKIVYCIQYHIPCNTGNFELTLEDGNNALKYFDFSASGVSVQRNGNKLTLSAPTEKQFNTITLKANKNLPKDVLPSLISGSPEYWLNPTQQSFASLDVSGSREAVPAFFKLHTEKIGHINLKKTSDDGAVNSLRFKVTGNGINRIYTTDKDAETGTLNGFVLDKTVHPFELTYQDAERTAFDIINRYIRFADKDENKERCDWETSPSWQWFLGADRGRLKLTTKPEPYTYQRTLHWLNRQVAPTLKMAMKLDKVNGTDYIDTMLEQAKLTEKHEKILQQQSAEMQDIITKESKD